INQPNLKLLGYSIISVTISMLIISFGCIFNLWGYILGSNNGNKLFSKSLVLDGDGVEIIDNYYIYAFFLSFVIIWIWCVLSWISMKLFRHSKG
ncbi:hypothetical protein CANARDRAFT_182811, partial [[Candida] arabinofermentans NRRL YB-2248]